MWASLRYVHSHTVIAYWLVCPLSPLMWARLWLREKQKVRYLSLVARSHAAHARFLSAMMLTMMLTMTARSAGRDGGSHSTAARHLTETRTGDAPHHPTRHTHAPAPMGASLPLALAFLITLLPHACAPSTGSGARSTAYERKGALG